MKNLKELSEQLLYVKSQLDIKMAELYENGVAYPEMNGEVVRLNNEITSINNEILSSKRELTANIAILRKEAIEKELLDVENRLNNRISELHNEGNPYPQLDKTVMNLEAKIPSLKTELSNIENYIANNNITSTLSELENQYKNIYSLMESRKKELYESGNQYPEMDTEIIRLNSKLTDLTQEIAKMYNKLKVDAYMIQKEELETKLDTLNNNLNDRMNTLNREENLYPQMDETVVMLNNEISALKNNIVELDKNYENNTLTDEVFNMVELPKVEVVNKTDDTIKEYSEQTVQNETVNKEQAQKLEKDDVNANNSKPVVETEPKETNNTNPEEQLPQQTVIENNGDLKQQLLGERKKLELKLIAIDRYINGEYDLQKNKTESFDSKIASLENQINSIKANKLNNQPVSATAIFAESRKKLEELISNHENEASDAEIKATQLYYTAVSLPTVKNVVESLRNASALPDTSIIKQSLIDTVSKAAVAYIKDEDEIKEINDVMSQLNLNTLNLNNNSSYDEQINQLYQDINNINYERECRKNKLQFTINKIKSKIANIDEQLKTLDNPTKEEENEKKQDDDILPPAPVDEEPSKNKIDEFIGKVKKLASDMNEKKEDKNNSKAEEFEKNNPEFKAYADKLSQIASGGAIFHDENRIDPENRWMEQKTAQALGKYNNDNMNINQPHVIKEKKKASLNLIQKVRNSKYAEKISIALEYLKKAKVAVVTTAMLVGIGAASLMAANQVEAEPTQQNQSQDNENSQSDYIENKENSNTELEETNENSEQNEVDNSFNAQLQEEINKILNGESGVYTSSDKAISGVDMKMPSANQLENSWTLAEPTTFYNIDGDKISTEDAMNKVENGEQVAARMDNDRGTAGYINIGASTEENTQGMAR